MAALPKKTSSLKLKPIQGWLMISGTFAILLFSGFQQTNNAIPRAFLAFNLMPTPGSYMATFAEVQILENGQKKVTILSIEDFIRIAIGGYNDISNPNRENFFVKYEVVGRDCCVDTCGKIVKFNVYPLLGMLWKLRYKDNVYMGCNNAGWTAGFRPSDAQFEMLKKYGINQVYDWCYGANAFRLFRDIQDLDFQNKYKSLK